MWSFAEYLVTLDILIRTTGVINKAAVNQHTEYNNINQTCLRLFCSKLVYHCRAWVVLRADACPICLFDLVTAILKEIDVRVPASMKVETFVNMNHHFSVIWGIFSFIWVCLCFIWVILEFVKRPWPRLTLTIFSRRSITNCVCVCKYKYNLFTVRYMGSGCSCLCATWASWDKICTNAEESHELI